MVGDAVGDGRLDRDLGEVAEHAGVVGVGRPSSGGAGREGWPRPASVERQAFIAWASWNVRRTVSMIRPMPCESEFTICDRAELVERPLGRHRRRMEAFADQREVLGHAERRRRG